MWKETTITDPAGSAMSNVIQGDDGSILPVFLNGAEEMINNIEKLADMPIRDDDIMLHTYPKAGTHWGYEILSMLLQGSTERKKDQKAELMLERVKAEDVEAVPSPRILNTHLPIKFLPKQVEVKRTKIVVVMRNPKDVAVSFYNMVKGAKRFKYAGKFKNFVVNFMNGKVPYGSWFDHTLEWSKAMETGKYNVHVAFYEDLKEDGPEEIKKIANFLGVNSGDELCRAITDACSFEKMKVEKAHPKELMDKLFRPGFEFYRKGQIGDWKNYFTVAESEVFDKIFDEKLAASKLKSRFKFEPQNQTSIS